MMAVIRVEDVSKKFKVYPDKGQGLKERLLFRARGRHQDHWVLKGVGFTAGAGESIGLIGENGSGKSTLLKLMTRIMYPDKGNIEIDGRVSSLIELGAGFHPNMSGRENIYTNASIFGLTRREIDARLEDIIAFSELGEAIDNPVRTYSSGMYMRLAFSVAINVDADVLLIDEILAVGDANFQAKCFERLRELKAAGVTTVIVTHDMSTVEKFCTRALWLKEGVVEAEGPPAKVVDAYLAFMNEKHYEQVVNEEDTGKAPSPADEAEPGGTGAPGDEAIDYGNNRFGLRYIEITKAELLDAAGQAQSIFRAGEPLRVVIRYQLHRPIDGYVFGFSFSTIEGVLITGSNTQLDRLDIPEVGSSGQVEVTFPRLPLLSGTYIFQVAVVDNNGRPMDYYRDYCHFEVVSSDRGVGLVSFDRTWNID